MKTTSKIIAKQINTLLSQVSLAVAGMTQEQRQTLIDNINHQFAFVPVSFTVSLPSSSLIVSAAYATNDQKLTVTLCNNRTYIYNNVPSNIVQDFSNSDSAGKFFNQNIRNKYDWAEF
jgi:hypothetical protein